MKISVLSGILIICFSGILQAEQTSTDSIAVTFEITVLPSTPEGATVFWAGYPNNWDPGDWGTGFGMKEYAKAATSQNGLWTIMLTAPQLLDETSYCSSLFLVGGHPSYFFIGPGGRVLAMGRSLESGQLIPMLEQYLE